MSVFIIAEISANHNNDFKLACDTVKAAAAAGADAVKVQTFGPESLALDVDNEYFGPKTEGAWKGWKPWDLYKKASLPYEWHAPLQRLASKLGLVFFSSPFDLGAVDFLESLDVPMYKIASFEINDIPLIYKVAKTGKPIIISTGVASVDDIELALETCRDAENNQITLLKCTSEYPAKIDMANLIMLQDFKEKFSVDVGVSDHSMGSLIPIVGVALGAKVIEKHLILDRKLGGLDSDFSMEPLEFTQMVEDVRNACVALGEVNYIVKPKDQQRKRSLFAIEDIKQGDILTEKNIRSLRPNVGLEPKYYSQLLGEISHEDIKKGQPIKLNILG